MRRPAAAWSRALSIAVALPILTAGCVLSLRGAGNPDGGPLATPTPFRAAGPPSVLIAAPDEGSAGQVGRTIAFDVRGSDSWPVGVARLELFAGDTLVDRALSAGGANRLNFGAVLEWTPSLPGTYEMSAFAYRADGTPSPPATVRLTITGSPLTPSPSPSPVPLTTPSPTPSPSPSPSLSPSPSPSPTPRPTQKPTATPTAAPVGVQVEVWVEEADLPKWTVGQPRTLTIHVQNIGSNSVSFVRVLASLAGSSGRTRTGSLAPGQETTVGISLLPEVAGEQLLSVEGRLPVGYYEIDPSLNTLAWERIVIVEPAPTEPPVVTASPDVTSPPGPPGPP